MFKPYHVPKVLDGSKTMTRRLRGLDKVNENPDGWELFEIIVEHFYYFHNHRTGEDLDIKCPYGVIGDEMWLKESYCYKADPITAVIYEDEIWYRATTPDVMKVDDDGGQAYRKDGLEASPWISPMFMPKKFSRFKRPITTLRCERLQDITYGDCIKEGVDVSDIRYRPGWDASKFINLWDSINPDHPWSKNEWVWVIGW